MIELKCECDKSISLDSLLGKCNKCMNEFIKKIENDFEKDRSDKNDNRQ